MKHGFLSKVPLLFMCAMSAFFGVIMIHLGIEQQNEIKNRPDPHDTVSGFLYGYEAVDETADGVMYRLQYAYYVGGEEYKLYVDTVRETEPELNSRVEIIYDVNDPAVSQIAYEETYPMLILAGALLLGAPVILVLAALFKSGIIPLKHVNVIEIAMGLAFAVFGLMFNFGLAKSFSPIDAITAGGFAAVFPVVFMAAGLVLIVKGAFFGKRNEE